MQANKDTQTKGYPFREGKDRKAASDEFDSLIGKIRCLSGFEDFLKPASKQKIQSTASKGPIIYINVSEYRCDALIIEQGSIKHVSLSQLNIEMIKRRLHDLDQSGPFDTDILQWLWDTIASPVLETLKLNDFLVTSQLPHVWWIPTGLISLFPLHAAGYHLCELPRTVLDVAMSSYSASLKAMQHSRSASTSQVSKAVRVALVAMETTPGQLRLEHAKAEVEAIRRICQSDTIEIRQPPASKDSVISELRSCDVFHFAGHGHANLSNPLQSSLLLDDWQDKPMTLEELLETNISERLPFLAYLSACETSRAKNERTIDEGLHLVNTFQLAGFRHVIGTLWKVDDELCKDVADIVYREVMEAKMTDDSVCLGLHTALKQCRDQWRSQCIQKVETDDGVRPTMHEARDYRPMLTDQARVLDWTPYVHFGA